MIVDVDRRPESIATGRTWRDIPPQPPTEVSASTPRPPEPIAPEGRGLQRWRIVALIGLLALVLGVALGQWAPWQDEPATDESAVAPQSNSVGQQPDSTTTLPPLIVPPPAADPLVPESLFPEDFFGFEGFPDLSGLFGEDFGRAPEFGTIGPETLNLIALNELPEGYQIAGTSLQSSSGRLTEQLTLRGPSGSVAVRAERSDEATLPNGASHEIGDVVGVLVDGDPTIFAWAAAADVLVTIEVPESVASDLLDSLVPSVQVLP